MPKQQLTDEILTAAIAGFEAQKEKIDSQIAELRQMMGGARSAPAVHETAGKPRRTISAAGRKRIAEAQRLRWAASRKGTGAGKSAGTAAPKAKRKLSAAGRKRISEATKKRWAAFKASKAAAAKNAG
jgi:hypothetical protein